MVHGAAGCNQYGASQNYWSPAATGSAFDLSPTALSPLEAYRNYLTIISNTDVRMAEAYKPEEIGGDHFRSSAVFLTQAHPTQTESSDIFVGASLDQMYAKRFGQDTPIPSMQLCIEPVDRARRLRVRLLVRLHGHDQLGVADRAAADDPRSARRVRPAVRRRRNGGRAFGPHEDHGQHSRLDHRSRRGAQARPERDRSAADGPVPREHPRDRAAHSAHRGAQRERRAARAGRRAGRRARLVRGSREADVRSPGARVPVRHDPRLLAQDGPRRVGPRLSGERRHDRLPLGVAPRRQSEARRRSSIRSTSITSACCRTSSSG